MILYWLKREQRIRDLQVLLRAARDGQKDAFSMYSAKCAEVVALKRENGRLQAELGKYEGATP